MKINEFFGRLIQLASLAIFFVTGGCAIYWIDEMTITFKSIASLAFLAAVPFIIGILIFKFGGFIANYYNEKDPK